jgi:hypothetical protein
MELLLILGVAFVLSCVPVLVMFLRAKRRFSGNRQVRCPETKRPAVVSLDAAHAAATNLTGDPQLKIASCNRWDGPVGHCEEGCVGEAEPSLLERPQSSGLTASTISR